VPTYNKRENVQGLVSRLTAALRDVRYELVFVDDSTEATGLLLTKIRERVRLVRSSIYLLVLYTLTSVGVPYLLSNLCGIGAAGLWNFRTNGQ